MAELVHLVDLRELVGRAEIAELAGIKLQTVDTWRRRYPTFPAPVGTISGTPLWLWPDVERWIHGTPRDVGRPGRTYARDAMTPLPDRLRHVIRTTPETAPDLEHDKDTDTA